MVNQYRQNSIKSLKRKINEKSPSLNLSFTNAAFMREASVDESEYLLKEDNSPRKRVIEKRLMPETEYEKQIKKKFDQKQRELTIQSYLYNRRDRINKLILKRFCQEEQKNPEYKYQKLKRQFLEKKRQSKRLTQVKRQNMFLKGQIEVLEDSFREDTEESFLDSSGEEDKDVPLDQYQEKLLSKFFFKDSA